MKTMFKLMSVAALFSLVACASGNAKLSFEEQLAKRDYRQGEEVKEVHNYRINGWNYLDEKHVIFNAGPGRDYLLALKIRCIDLRSADTLGFTSTNTRLSRFDKVVVATETGERSCPIDKIYELDKIE